MQSLPVYRPSGRVGLRAWLLFGLVGVPAAATLGWGYANALALVTWRPAAIFIALVLWAALAVLVSILVNRSHARSPTFARWAGASIGLVAVWAHWVVLLKIFGGSTTAAAFAQSGPVGWLAIIARFSSEQDAGRGIDWLSYAGWALEAVVSIGLPASFGATAAMEPYSEARREWAISRFKGELVAPGASSASLAALLHERGTRELMSMQAASSVAMESVAAQWWTVEIEGLAVLDDPEARWLHVTTLVQTRNKHGRIEITRQPVVRAWHVVAEEFDAVRSHLNPADGAAPDSLDRAKVATATPPALQPAVAALERGDFAAAFDIAEAHVRKADLPFRADALRVCALAASRTERWSVAADHFDALFSLEPTAFNALQVASTLVCAGELAPGVSWLAKAHEINDGTREMQPPRIDTAFLSALEQRGEHAAAMPLLDRLAAAYCALPVLDDHYVWSHGLPFFGEFMRKSLPVLQQVLSDVDVENWYRRLRSGLSPDGVAMLEAHIANLKTALARMRH